MAVSTKAPKWIQRFWKDFTEKKFIPVKVLFFTIYGASMAMFPFLTLQARSLGINERELGIVYAFNPVIAILGPPLTGMVADRIGNFKYFLSMTMAASGLAALTFSAVPPGRRTIPLPENLPLRVTCGGELTTEAELSLELPHRCDYLDNVTSVNVALGNCTLCGTQRSLAIVAEEEKALCQEEGASSSGCVLDQYLANVSRQISAKLAVDLEGNSTQLHIQDWTCPQVSLESLDLAAADSIAYNSAADQDSQQNGAANCTLQCKAYVSRDALCSNKVTEEDIDPMLTFWCYLLVRILNTLTLATSFTLFDGAAIAVVREHKGDYGLQRLYGNLGGIVITPISGQLIDYFSEVNNFQDYRPAFYVYCFMKVLAAIIILFVDLDFRQPSNRVLKDFRMLIKKPEIVSFLAVMLITGTCYGLLDTFLFWLLQDLGATKFLMGITVTVGSVAGIPVLIASGYIFKKLGLANTIVLGMLVYFIRMIGYSFLTSPWWCMPFESLECFTVSLLGAAAVSYAAELSTPATLATLQGVYGGLHYGVGRGIGSLIGGFMMKPIGVRNTFRLTGAFSLAAGVVYFFVNRIFFQKLQDERKKIQDEEMKKNEDEEKGKIKNGEATLGDTTVIKEKHAGIIENGIKNPDGSERDDGKLKENSQVDKTKEGGSNLQVDKTKEDGSVTAAHNAGFVSDE
ncbi:LOW QUALITY PROTEIN: major facilitator superfamily domain-containing protein 6-A-like [Palaemon carinicauda]|uniref:LOW QUALITY PROTEIN: major facilitator superfamily domain-containing protein 6-A-like n=1 Tax=Palaemon carinicauda TaxID=392227 RepID=UPI0035B573A8